MESNNLKRTRCERDGVDCSEDKKDEHQVKKKAKMDNKIKNWGKIFLDIELRDQLLEHLKNEESVRKGFIDLYQCLNPQISSRGSRHQEVIFISRRFFHINLFFRILRHWCNNY